ncbi:MAG TPA: phosphatase PAP2 family protein [Gemmatimonadales bacterium]|nr:phosphatase PAP2 family protein [Gemmatimonadales bacterium]
MHSESGRRFRTVDLLLLGFLALASGIALVRIGERPLAAWALVAYGLIALLVLLLTARPASGPVGRVVREIYPLLLVVPIYSSLDLLNGIGQIRVHDDLVRHWERLLFGAEVSRVWWQQHGSRFWSVVFHASYFSYYIIIPLPLAWFALTGDLVSLRRSVLIIFSTFLVCYVCFLLFPVAGPYYEFARPATWFINNGPARLVYAVLSTGSSYGAAFPSSHVAATVAAAVAGWLGSRKLGIILTIPTILLTIGVVYCQMHYAVDALAGVAVGGFMAWGFRRGEDGRTVGR